MTAGARARIDILGPIRVVGHHGEDLTPPGPLGRKLLALLVLCRGRVVPVDAAVEALWPGAPPQDPAGSLQNHVSRLRRLLPPDLIRSMGDGYRLEPRAVDVDCDRLAALVSHGSVDTSTMVAVDDLFARWHGPAYPELDDLDEARIERSRLDELRVRAREIRAEHLIRTAAADAAVTDLTALVEAEPLRERPRALLMEALGATGRIAEALRVHDDFRRVLGAELGIEPSPALAAQHTALLQAGPATPTPSAPATRLPTPLTSLIGREQRVGEIVELAASSRLVTLVGPGGVGKTRLLVEVGHRLHADRPTCPVVLCELATADEESVTVVVAGALGIDARPGIPLAQQLSTVLGDAELVLLADNCEHVLEATAELVEGLLRHCPHLHVVATSRERLRISGEQVCTVPTLPVSGNQPAAVELFLERARAVVPGYSPSAEEMDAITELVRRLDGLPLAIELAAARLFTHELSEVMAGLDRGFATLSSGPRTTPRHESLWAAMTWSYGLLDDRLQGVFSSLSVFAGAFDIADAAAVGDLDETDAAEALSRLVERSLLMRTDRRYVLLETLRSFGSEQLVAAGRDREVRDRHARHITERLEQARRRMRDAESHAIVELDDSIPEANAALRWLVETGEVELAGRLVVHLLDYGFLRLRPDVLAWAERVLATDVEAPSTQVVLAVASYAAWMVGRLDLTRDHTERAIGLAEAAGVPVEAEVATAAGNVELFDGRLDEAVVWYRRALHRAQEVGDPARHDFVEATEILALGYAGDPSADERATTLLARMGETATPYAAYAWYCAGEVLLDTDPHRARACFDRSLEVAEATRATFVTGLAGASAASIEARDGDPRVAADAYRDLIVHWRRAGVWATQWTVLRSIAALLARLERPGDAAVLVGAVRATTSGHRIFGRDESTLVELEQRLRAALGEDAYAAAAAEGALLDGDAAVEHALAALGPPVTSAVARR